MKAIETLLWLEVKRASWVLYGAAIAMTLFGLVLVSLPGKTTGLEMLNVPSEQDATSCVPPDCEDRGRTQVEIERQEDEGGSSFHWSFSRRWGDETGPGVDDPTRATPPPATAGSQTIPVAVPEELQFAARPRQFLTVMASVLIPTLMLLGFWIAYSREADRGDMVMLYQSPISGDVQLFVRFVFMSVAMSAVALATIAIYWIVQTTQSLPALAPVVEVLGGRANLHWGSLILAGLVTGTLPNAAFVLLFIQMQNAYGLLGGQRLAAMVLILVSVVAFFVSMFGGDPAPGTRVLEIVSIESNSAIDSVFGGAGANQYRLDITVETLAVAATLTVVMQWLAGRIWREVEWS